MFGVQLSPVVVMLVVAVVVRAGLRSRRRGRRRVGAWTMAPPAHHQHSRLVSWLPLLLATICSVVEVCSDLGDKETVKIFLHAAVMLYCCVYLRHKT